MKQPKICKCGHGKDNHYKHPEKTIKFLTACQSCPCTSYLNRRAPFKSDLVFLFVGVGIIGMLAFMVVTPFIDSHMSMNVIVPIPAGVLFVLLGVVFGYFSIYVISPLMIESYFQAKKRKEYPIASQ